MLGWWALAAAALVVLGAGLFFAGLWANRFGAAAEWPLVERLGALLAGAGAFAVVGAIAVSFVVWLAGPRISELRDTFGF